MPVVAVVVAVVVIVVAVVVAVVDVAVVVVVFVAVTVAVGLHLFALIRVNGGASLCISIAINLCNPQRWKGERHRLLPSPSPPPSPPPSPLVPYTPRWTPVYAGNCCCCGCVCCWRKNFCLCALLNFNFNSKFKSGYIQVEVRARCLYDIWRLAATGCVATEGEREGAGARRGRATQ